MPNTLQPPCSTGSLTLSRLTAVPHSLVASSTLSPSFFKSCSVTSASACSCAMSAGSRTTIALTLVAGLGDEALGAVPVARPRQDAAVVFVGLGAVAAIDREAGAPVARIAGHRAHVVALIGDREHRLARLDVVERRMEVVEADHADKAGIALHRDIWVVRQRGGVIVRRVLEIVDLAGFERLHRGRRLGDIDPFDAIDLYHLAAGGIVRRLGTRHIVRVPDVDGLVAGLPLLLDEFERSRAVDFADLREGVGLAPAARAG